MVSPTVNRLRICVFGSNMLGVGCTCVIPALGKSGKDSREFRVTFGYIASFGQTELHKTMSLKK